MKKVIDRLLKSDEPSIVYKTLVNVLNESPNSPKIKKVEKKIRESQRVTQLLSNLNNNGLLEPVKNPYKKWIGAHWVLTTLADIGYPKSDKKLLPIVNQVLRCWSNPIYFKSYETKDHEKLKLSKKRGVPIINGKYRRCASQQSNAIFSALSLGFENNIIHELAKLLLKWQWPDGGWNCDTKPNASCSSFYESITPLRALGLYSRLYKNNHAKKAVKRTTDFFLQRNLYKSKNTGKILNEDFMKLHYPCYWHYDILFALKILAENNLLKDEHCNDALNFLENKYIEDEGWPVEGKYYKITNDNAKKNITGNELVNWGKVNKKKMNEWITADALFVLNKAKRIKV